MSEERKEMKDSAGKFLAVLLLVVAALSVLPLNVGAAGSIYDEEFVYNPGGERCSLVEIQVQMADDLGVKFKDYPPGLKRDVEKCKKYEKPKEKNKA